MTGMTWRFLVGLSAVTALLLACNSPSPSPTLTEEQSERIERYPQQSHDLVKWDEPPTFRNGRLTFSGSLLGEAVLTTGTNEQVQAELFPQKFRVL